MNQHRLITRAAVRLAMAATVVVVGNAAHSQTLVNNLGGALSLAGTDNLGIGGIISQIAFAPGDNAHAYIATFGAGILRADYNPNAANPDDIFTNVVSAVDNATASQGGVPGSLGITFHQDPTLGTVMYIAPAVPFGSLTLSNQNIVRLTDGNGDGMWGNNPADVNQAIVTGLRVSQLHQVNQMEVRGNALYAGIGIRTQNGGQTAAQNQAIGGSGVNQSNPGETAYTGTVAFIGDLTQLSGNTGTANIAGFTVGDVTGNGIVNDNDYKADTQPFTSNSNGKLRVYATGFRNNFGLGIDDNGQMWVSMNQNENPNAQDELHRNVTFRSDHGFFKGNDVVGDWRVPGDDVIPGDPSQTAINAGYFNPANNVAPTALLGFNTAAGGLDFIPQNASDASLRGDVLVARNAGGGQDIYYVDAATGTGTVVLENLSSALELKRDPFGNFLAAGGGRVSLLRIAMVAIPEPASLTLAATALLSAVAFRRRAERSLT